MSTSLNYNIQTSFGYKLKKTQHALRISMDINLKKLKLTAPQYGVLSQLESKVIISNAELAKISFITPQTMHRIVSNLENQGFIIKNKSTTHARILYIELTSKGHKILVQSNQIIKVLEQKMLSSIKGEHKLLLEKLLLECLDNLNT